MVGQGRGEGWKGGDSTVGVSAREAGQGRGRSSNLLQGERRQESGVVLTDNCARGKCDSVGKCYRIAQKAAAVDLTNSD